MRRFIFSCFFLLIASSSNAQVVVENVNINDLEHVKICQIVATGRFFSNKVTITVDYGQEIKWSSNKGTQVLDKNGKKRTFNTVIEAINHMEINGWEYLEANIITLDTGLGKQNVYHYYFRKRE